MTNPIIRVPPITLAGRNSILIQTPFGHAIASYTKSGIMIRLGHWHKPNFWVTSTFILPDRHQFYDGFGWDVRRLSQALKEHFS